MLEFRNVKKIYNKRLILDIPSLALENGCFWLKGENGSGKTTLLKMIAGLIPFEGDIVFNGISLQSSAFNYRCHASWAEAEPTYPPFMTGIELIGLYRNIRKVEMKEVTILLDMFNMNDYVNNQLGTYSAGMTKKLSFVLAFMGNPPLILLDEPCITLDAEGYEMMCTYITTKHKEGNTTFLLSSHQALSTVLLQLMTVLNVQNKHVVR